MDWFRKSHCQVGVDWDVHRVIAGVGTGDCGSNVRRAGMQRRSCMARAWHISSEIGSVVIGIHTATTCPECSSGVTERWRSTAPLEKVSIAVPDEIYNLG